MSDEMLAARIIRKHPLITASVASPDLPLGLVSAEGSATLMKEGLHFVFVEPGLNPEDIGRRALQAQTRVRTTRGQIVLLVPTADMLVEFSRRGAATILAAPAIFADEAVWAPVAAGPQRFDATFFGALTPDLDLKPLRDIERLQLIATDAALDARESAAITVQVPRAEIVNRDAEGRLISLERADIARRLAIGGVALALPGARSSEETMAALLCGRPVVSVGPLRDGRDRFLLGGYTRAVPPDADAVRATVAALNQLRLDPLRIRAHVGETIAFERHTFLLALNEIGARCLEGFQPFADLEAFRALPFVKTPRAGLRLQQKPIGTRRADEPGEAVAGVGKANDFVLLLGRARTGTNLIRDLISTQTGYWNAGEVFNPNVAHRLRHHFANFLKSSLNDLPQPTLSGVEADTILAAYWADLSRKAEGRTALVDVKDNSFSMLDWETAFPSARPRLLRSILGLDAPIIQMKRRNLLAQLASLELARMTDVWVSKDLDNERRDLTITLDPAAVVSQLDHARDADAALSRMLRGKAGVYEFFYEDLTVDDALAPAFVSLVTSLTGRPFDKPVTARTVKLARPLPDLVENFDAIAAVLRGTEYEPLLSMV
jgi:hypothetical protein